MSAKAAPKSKQSNPSSGEKKSPIFNLKGHTRGGRRVTLAHLKAFCVEYHFRRSVEKAAIAVGLSARKGWELKADQRYESVMKEVQQEIIDKIIKERTDEFKLELSEVDETMYRLMAFGETHFVRGDQDRVKAGETLYKRLGKIMPGMIYNHNENSANANASASSAQLDIYAPAWLRQREMGLLAQLEEKYKLPVHSGKKMTLEQAQQYLDRANGDKDKARELARTEGWEL